VARRDKEVDVRKLGAIRPVWIAAFVTALAVPATADWAADLDSLLHEQDAEVQAALIERVASDAPGWEAVYQRLQAITFEEPEQKGELLLFTAMCDDDVERPYVLYIPSSYAADVRTPLLVWLHGGANQSDLPEDPVGVVKEYRSEVVDLAERRGWLALFPFAQRDAAWWDEVGFHNVLDQIRTVKTGYNIDDDRLWMGGFSDGASAAYLFGMILPSDFAAFVALNGHMGVGSLAGDLPTYANNMAATPVYAINTGQDRLYPARVMRRTVAMARRAGADIYYKEYDDVGHEFAYSEQELPLIAEFLERHPRCPFPHRLTWEAAGDEVGQCRWFRIDDVNVEGPEPWHQDYNEIMLDERVVFGFYADYDYEGEGVKVDGLVEGDVLASRLPLLEGDVIVKCDDVDIKTRDDLDEFKTSIKRGDQVQVRVEREGQAVDLVASLPDVQKHLLFKRQVPSAKAKVSFEANHVSVAGSRLGGFTLLLHPEMFHFDRPVAVEVDGEVVFQGTVEPNVALMLQNFVENRDRKTLYIAELTVDLPEPQ
jgi:predicted esterase